MYFLFFPFSPLTTPLMCSFVNVKPLVSSIKQTNKQSINQLNQYCGRKKQLSKNISEYHPPVGIWIVCRVPHPLIHHTMTPLLQTLSVVSSTQNPGLTALEEWLEWIWNFTVLVEIAMIPMT
jgi:hypothetical protein